MITVKELYSLEQEIIKIFEKYPDSKNDDMMLYYYYCQKKLDEYYEYNGLDESIDGIEILVDFKDIFINNIWREKLNVSPYSAVERCARKIRARENKVDDIKVDMELVFKQYALDKE